MAFNEHYLPPDFAGWQAQVNGLAANYFREKISTLNINTPKINALKPGFVLLGFRCDAGIERNLGRSGAMNGPDQCRKALTNLAIHRSDIHLYDAGNIICRDDQLESAQLALGTAVKKILALQLIPIIIGGGHELAWGHFQGLKNFMPQAHIGIVNFDAHFDMRPLLAKGHGSSGTPFLQIALAEHQRGRPFYYDCIGIQGDSNILALFQTAKHHQAQTLLAEQLADKLLCDEFVENSIQRSEVLYVSVCLDVFASAFAPGVSAPNATGVLPWQVLPLLRQFSASKKVLSYDIAELSPPYDIEGQTAALAAYLIYEIIHHHHFKD